MDQAELTATWATVMETLQTDFQVSSALSAFLDLTRPVALVDGTFMLLAPNDLTKRMIEDRLRSSVLDILQNQLDQPGLLLRVIVDPVALRELDTQQFAAENRSAGDAQTLAPSPQHSDEHFTFDGHLRAHESLADHEAGSAASPLIPRPHPGDSSVLTSGQAIRLDAGHAAQVESRLEARADTEPGRSPVAGFATAGRAPEAERFGPPPTDGIAVPGRRPRDNRQTEPARLNPKYTFDRFVIGSSNRFAHAAAVAVAEAPAQAYNPLFVYGESGLGKTHLLHAIGDYAQHLWANVQVRFVNSEEFTNEFINSIRDDRASVFQHRYRDVDILLIDDIQFLQGKVQTQEEFFHTFNALHQANKQVVITSDVAPRALSGFEERMRSRFEWGLLTDVQPPDLETRIAILRKKAAADRLDAPDNVLEYIASNVSTNIRELEGALIRVTAFANLSKKHVDLDLAQSVLKDLIGEQQHEITAALIITKTADYFELKEEDIVGASRSRILVTARQVAMYLCREMTDLSLPKIGAAFGGRDHTTVMHANRKVRELMKEKHSIYQQVTDLAIRIRQQ